MNPDAILDIISKLSDSSRGLAALKSKSFLFSMSAFVIFCSIGLSILSKSSLAALPYFVLSASVVIVYTIGQAYITGKTREIAKGIAAPTPVIETIESSK